MNRTITAAIVLFALAARADMGSIPFRRAARIFEPDQRVLLAWNGRDQITILSTDLHADRETKVLEVMPFPSEPKVVRGDIEVFQRATRMINLRQRSEVGGGFGGGFHDAAGGGPAGRVTFHERIGAHDVAVIQVERPEAFVDWVNEFLKKQGVEQPQIPEPLKAVIEEYILDNFRWFVFDVVSLTEKPSTKDALQFTFRTEFLFFPLRIMRTEEGDTRVKALVLTPGTFQDGHLLGLERGRLELENRPVELTEREVLELGRDLHELFRGARGRVLRQWTIRGRISEFQQDLIVGPPDAYRRHRAGEESPDRRAP